MPLLSYRIQIPTSQNSSPPFQMALLLPLTEIASLPGVAAALRRRTASSSRNRRSSARTAVQDQEVAAAAAGRIIRITDPIKQAVLSPLFLSPVLSVSSSSPPLWQPPPPQQGDGGDERQQYYLNLGYAIRTLREELPEIFYREPTFDIYRDDIVFKDRLNTFTGIENYKRIFWALRLNGRIFFKALWVDIVSVWQPADNVIMIRWIAHGIPRVPWEARGRFDGNSEYKLDKNGKIYEHRVDNVALNTPTKFRVLTVEELMQSLGCPSTPKPTYFETVLSSVVVCMPFLLSFSWVRYYLAFHITLALRSVPKE